MVQFSEAQIDEISARYDRRMREALAQRLREKHAPDLERLGVAPADHEAQLAFLERAAEGALRCGMDGERPMRVFVAIALINARHRVSDTVTWARALLERTDADGASKAALIEHEAQRLAASDPHAAELAEVIGSLCGPA